MIRMRPTASELRRFAWEEGLSKAKNGKDPFVSDACNRSPDRRQVIVGGTVLAAGASVLGSDAEAAAKPERLLAQPGDRFQIVKGALKDEFVKPGLLDHGARPFEAFPFDPESEVLRRKNRLNRVLVLRLDPNEMDEETRERSVDGVLAYSALCTHRACTIKSWMEEVRHLRCHCHLSEFAALSSGSVKAGPAKRQLPMVPLGLDDEGFVVAVSEFTRKPGAAKK